MANAYQGTYQPAREQPYKFSRSQIENFIRCPRCFYLDRRLGIKQPQGPPFTLNTAIDGLLKAEFDAFRRSGTRHPLQEQFGVDAVPAPHKLIDKWRENFHGVQALHEPTNLLITGAIDDLWIGSDGRYVVADYKATARAEPVTQLEEGGFYDSYRRQMEIYQWLLRRNGLDVSDTAYFVYCSGRKHLGRFDAKLEFDINLIPYTGSDAWVEPKLLEIKKTLDAEQIPASDTACEFCQYYTQRRASEERALP